MTANYEVPVADLEPGIREQEFNELMNKDSEYFNASPHSVPRSSFSRG